MALGDTAPHEISAGQTIYAEAYRSDADVAKTVECQVDYLSHLAATCSAISRRTSLGRGLHGGTQGVLSCPSLTAIGPDPLGL